MTIYYVYAYLRQDNTPYYIGKGKGNRAFAKHKHVYTPTDTTRIVFLERNLTNIGALALERRYIRWYGRKDLNNGILRNLTDGGEGGNGLKHTDESRIKMSVALKGRKASDETRSKMSSGRTGIKKSKEHCQKLSESAKGRTLSVEHRKKLSDAKKGTKGNHTGFKHSEEAKAKMRAAKKKL